MPNDKEFELDDLESFSFDDLSLDDDPPASEAATVEDPLGVWVKSGPEDVESFEVPPPDFAVSPPQAVDGLPEEDFLSSEELANLDDSFEFVTVSEEPLEGETDLDDDMAFLDTPEAVEAERTVKENESAPSFNEVSLDDFVTFDETPTDEDSSSAPSVTEESSDPELDSSFDDAEAFDEEFLDIDIDIENEINDEELEILEGSRAKPEDAKENPAAVGSQDIDLSEFVDFEEVSPAQESLLAEGDDLPEVRDVPAAPEPFLVEDDGTFEESVIEEPLPALHDEGPILDVDLEPDDHTDMDHILALEEDLTSGIRETESTPPLAAAAQPSHQAESSSPQSDLAAQILGKIEQELSSIKQEISELKREVTHLRVAPPEPAPEAPASFDAPLSEDDSAAFETPETQDDEPETGKASHGFFDEEDDETIALTGDELDNILSTAEISEGEEVGLSLDEDLLNLDSEGNLIEPETSAEAESEVVHVTDEEFLAGTSLDLNEPEVSEGSESEGDAFSLGVPQSIELEESLSVDLDGETEDLLSDDLMAEAPETDTEETPLEEAGLELIDSAPLAPELSDSSPAPSEDWDLDSLTLDEEKDEAAPGADTEGWSTPSEQPEAETDASIFPPPPPVSPPQPAPAGSAMSDGVKDELRAVLSYMDKLLASLPDDKIQEFAESEHFEVYKRLFEELGLIE